MKLKTNGISINELAQLAATDKQHQNLWLGLGKIDVTVQKFVKDIVQDVVDNPQAYSLRTEYMNLCYSVILFSADRQAYVGVSWPMVEFLNMCQNAGKVELEINVKVRKMLLKFEETGIRTGDKINWIY